MEILFFFLFYFISIHIIFYLHELKFVIYLTIAATTHIFVLCLYLSISLYLSGGLSPWLSQRENFPSLVFDVCVFSFSLYLNYLFPYFLQVLFFFFLNESYAVRFVEVERRRRSRSSSETFIFIDLIETLDLIHKTSVLVFSL